MTIYLVFYTFNVNLIALNQMEAFSSSLFDSSKSNSRTSRELLSEFMHFDVKRSYTNFLTQEPIGPWLEITSIIQYSQVQGYICSKQYIAAINVLLSESRVQILYLLWCRTRRLRLILRYENIVIWKCIVVPDNVVLRTVECWTLD